jgi:hypothetical protein
VKLQFDANQQYQLDAVAAVTDLFDGQPQGAPEYSVINMGDWGDGPWPPQAVQARRLRRVGERARKATVRPVSRASCSPNSRTPSVPSGGTLPVNSPVCVEMRVSDWMNCEAAGGGCWELGCKENLPCRVSCSSFSQACKFTIGGIKGFAIGANRWAWRRYGIQANFAENVREMSRDKSSGSPVGGSGNCARARSRVRVAADRNVKEHRQPAEAHEGGRSRPRSGRAYR